jgi:formylglycine-generating enzyme required for sulfatase activity
MVLARSLPCLGRESRGPRSENDNPRPPGRWLWGWTASARVLRGGSFDYDEFRVRCAYRGDLNLDFKDFNVGFRVVVAPGS